MIGVCNLLTCPAEGLYRKEEAYFLLLSTPAAFVSPVNENFRPEVFDIC
jgi:hypothetical protein